MVSYVYDGTVSRHDRGGDAIYTWMGGCERFTVPTQSLGIDHLHVPPAATLSCVGRGRVRTFHAYDKESALLNWAREGCMRVLQRGIHRAVCDVKTCGADSRVHE
jgi:hypothetical protein